MSLVCAAGRCRASDAVPARSVPAVDGPRVLHISTDLQLGGAQKSVAAICLGLQREGYDVHVACSSRAGRVVNDDILPQQLQQAGIDMHDVPAMRRLISPPHDIIAFVQLVRLMRRLKPTIVHTHCSKAGILGRLAAAAASVPIVVHSQRGWSFYAAGSAVTRWLYIACEHVAAPFGQLYFAVSHAVVRDGVALRLGTPDRYRVVRSGIDLAPFLTTRKNADRPAARRQLGIDEDCRIVGSVCRLVQAKAPLDLVAVARQVLQRRPDTLFIVVGDGPMADDLVDAAHEAGLGDRFRMLGRRDDIPEAMAAMDVFLLTSRWEGFPRVLVEAAAVGLPIVATDVTDVAAFVDTVGGRSAPPGDVDALAEGVLALLDDPTTHGPVDAAYLEEFSLPRVIRDHVEIYSELLAERGVA